MIARTIQPVLAPVFVPPALASLRTSRDCLEARPDE